METCQSVTHLILEQPESEGRPDAQWRMMEWVRVLNASKVIEDAVKPTMKSYNGMAFVHHEHYYLDKPGKKFTRVVVCRGNQRFVHAFVENATGMVIKSAGWASPAKEKAGLAYRYDLMDEDSRITLYTAGTNANMYKV